MHWDHPEGWCGEGGGRRVQDGEHIKKRKKKSRVEFGIYKNTMLRKRRKKKRSKFIKNIYMKFALEKIGCFFFAK